MACIPLACDVLAGTPLDPQSGAIVDVDFHLRRGGRIEGLVREVSIDRPVPDAIIVLYGQSGDPFAEIPQSGSRYRSPPMPKGSYFLVANAPNRESRLHPGLPCPKGVCDVTTGIAVEIQGDLVVDGIDFRLPLAPGATLQPTVVYLNRCHDGCVVRPGNDNSITNQSARE